MRLTRLVPLALSLPLSVALLAGCSDDGPSTTGSDETATETETGDGDGDGDGDGNGDGDGDPGDEGLACPLVNDCLIDCQGDMACQAMCLAEASPNAQLESAALLQCIQDNNCNNDNCIEQNCGVEAYTCYTGGGSCGDMTACIEVCAGDEVCEANCYYISSPLAQGQIEALQGCSMDNACEDEACLVEFCNVELQSCVGGLSDVLPCASASGCLLECGDDPICPLICAPVDPEAQMETDALVACGMMEGCNSFDCTEQACPDEWAMCLTGEANCADSWACLLSCQGAEICEAACVTDAAPLDQLGLIALAECAVDNSCEDEACIADNCGPEAMTCGVL